MSTSANAKTVDNATAWHAMSRDEVVERLETDAERGLTPLEASARLSRFFAQFNNVLIYVPLESGDRSPADLRLVLI